MQESKVADNQQERPNEYELGWLAGVIDGEGCLQVANKSLTSGASPRLTISNTNQIIISKLEEIIHKMGVGCYVYNKTVYSTKHNPCSVLVVLGYKRLVVMLEIITPYLVGKRQEAELMLEFIRSRISNYSNTLPALDRQYSEWEYRLLEEITALKSHR